MKDPTERRYRVLVIPTAIQAIDAQYIHIRDNQQAPLEAIRWLSRIWSAIGQLEFMPTRFGLAPENAHRPYEVRRMILGNHLLLFTIDETDQTVYVMNLRHGAMRPRPDQLPETPT